MEDCCRDPDNREFYKLVVTRDGATRTEECTECGRKHHIAQFVPKEFSLKIEGENGDT